MGVIWVQDQSGARETKVWWPYESRVGEVAVAVLEGQARWHPKQKGWFVPVERRDEILAALRAL